MKNTKLALLAAAWFPFLLLSSASLNAGSDDAIVLADVSVLGSRKIVKIPASVWRQQAIINIRTQSLQLDIGGAIALFNAELEKRWPGEAADVQLVSVELKSGALTEQNRGVYYFQLSFYPKAKSDKVGGRTMNQAFVLMSKELYFLY